MSQHWSARAIGRQNAGAVERLNSRAPEQRSARVLEQWSAGAEEHQSVGATDRWSSRAFEQQGARVAECQSSRATERWRAGASAPRSVCRTSFTADEFLWIAFCCSIVHHSSPATDRMPAPVCRVAPGATFEIGPVFGHLTTQKGRIPGATGHISKAAI